MKREHGIQPEGKNVSYRRNHEQQFLIFLAEEKLKTHKVLGETYQAILTALNTKHGRETTDVQKPAFLLFTTVRAFRRALLEAFVLLETRRELGSEPHDLTKVYSSIATSFTEKERKLLDDNYATMDKDRSSGTEEAGVVVEENEFIHYLNHRIFDGNTAYTLVYDAPYKTFGLAYAIVDMNLPATERSNFVEDIANTLHDLFYFNLEKIDLQTLTVLMNMAKKYTEKRKYPWSVSVNVVLWDMLSNSSAISWYYGPFGWKLSPRNEEIL